MTMLAVLTNTLPNSLVAFAALLVCVGALIALAVFPKGGGDGA